MQFRLTEIENNVGFIISDFVLDRESQRRLNNMGIYKRDKYFRSAGNGNGPVIIQNISNNATPIAIGRELADGILVNLSDNI